MSESSNDKNLLKKVESLVRENKNLRKKLGRLSKVANYEIFQSSSEEDLELAKEAAEKHKVKECDTCRGEIKKFSVYNLEFEVCQRCKTRTRVK